MKKTIIKFKWELLQVIFLTICFGTTISLEILGIISFKTAYIAVLAFLVIWPIFCIETDARQMDLWLWRKPKLRKYSYRGILQKEHNKSLKSFRKTQMLLSATEYLNEKVALLNKTLDDMKRDSNQCVGNYYENTYHFSKEGENKYRLVRNDIENGKLSTVRTADYDNMKEWIDNKTLELCASEKLWWRFNQEILSKNYYKQIVDENTKVINYNK